MTNETSDGEIAQQIATAGGGAEAAERALCERFAPRIRLYGLRHLRDDGLAGDLVQSVLVRVLEALREGRIETPDRLGSFVLGTCRFIAWDMRRAERRQVAIQKATLTLHAETQPPSTSEADKLRLFRCLQELPARDSQVVRMSFLEDRPADEIAELSPSHPEGAACSIFA